MIKTTCNHEWTKHSNAGREIGAGTIHATFFCEKCKTELTAGEAFQLEALNNQTTTLKHLKGFQKWHSIIALIVSGIAVTIAGLTLYFSFAGKI